MAAGALWGGVAWGAAKPSYSLSVPGAPIIRTTDDASVNQWLASNYVASVSAAFAVLPLPAMIHSVYVICAVIAYFDTRPLRCNFLQKDYIIQSVKFLPFCHHASTIRA